MNAINSEAIGLAGIILDQKNERDLVKPNLLELTGASQYGVANVSGLNDYDYQNINLSGHKSLYHIEAANKIPIPAEILEHFKHIKCQCLMGLFPEIGRAWLTVDSEIYIWTYEQTRDVAYYDGLNQIIIGVGLVKPKAEVFVNDIKYLLVLATAFEIIVLGVTFGTESTNTIPLRNVQNGFGFQEMQLINKPVFMLPSDNINFCVIKCTEGGRIFLGGHNGSLYEVSYQAESSWFGKRCKKINHSQTVMSYVLPNIWNAFLVNGPLVQIEVDESRHLLYTLDEKGNIEAWHMGDKNHSMQRIAKINQNEILQTACKIIKTVDTSVLKTIKVLCPLSKDEFPTLHLLAVTQCGVRLYFSTQPAAYQKQYMQHQIVNSNLLSDSRYDPSLDVAKQKGLYLIHIRLPPGYTPNTTINKPKNIHLAYNNEGNFLLASAPQQDQGTLWSISSIPFTNTAQLTESTAVLSVEGIIWSLAEIPDRYEVKTKLFLRKTEKRRQVALLTNQGITMINLLKPKDIFQQLLLAFNGPNNDAVKAFFETKSECESSITCLHVACSEENRNSDLAMWAAQAFIMYGGEPTYISTINSPTKALTSGKDNRPLDSFSNVLRGDIDRCSPQMFISTPMPNVGISSTNQFPINTLSQRTVNPQSSVNPMNKLNFTPVKGMEPSNIVYSAKHDALYIYLARLLRPFWKKSCIDVEFNSTITTNDCSLILDEIKSLKSFMEINNIHDTRIRSHNSHTVLTDSFSQMQQTTSHQHDLEEQAEIEEKKSLTALLCFIKHTCEIIGLWKILSEHQLATLVRQLIQDHQTVLMNSTFRDLTLIRTEICAVLIVELINSYLKDNASISSISSRLRDVCPNLFSHEDAVSFKATEILMSSKNCTTQEDRNEKLRAALQLCKDAAPNLPLQNICQQFTMAEFYHGVIDLTSTCAIKIDPDEIGIHFYNNNEPTDDKEGYAAFSTRMQIYKEVRVMLDHLYQKLHKLQVENEFPQSNNYAIGNDRSSPNEDIMDIMCLALRIKDPILHVNVYEWLLSHEMFSEMLSLFPPTLGEYLRRRILLQPDNLQLIDLLWKFYEKSGQHSQAALILNNLANMKSDSIQLDKRIEYLARAVMCMRNDTVGYSVSNGILLKELEDKLDIARVQRTVLDSLSNQINSCREAAIAVKELNSTLFDITKLYQHFANRFDLWECKLIILNCSHHNDPHLIESIWLEIINQAVETSDGSKQSRCKSLFAKIESLVKEFSESGHCFPLAFLLRELEVKACHYDFPEGIVVKKLLAMNLDIELLLEYYSRMISMNERVWINEGNEWHLVQSSICLVTDLVDNANKLLPRSKRRIISKGQDIIAVCLNLCYQKPGTLNLQNDLKELQCKLQRCLV